MGAVVGKFLYNHREGQVTIRCIDPVVRIALNFCQATTDESSRALIKKLERLKVPGWTEVFDLQTPETLFVILAGARFGSIDVTSSLNGKELSIKTARKILDQIEKAASEIKFQELESYSYL